MRKVTKVALLVSGAVAVGAYLGFPTRVGLTKSGARVSMPGDLLLPAAKMQADRAATLGAPPGKTWALSADLKDLYEDMFDAPMDLIYEEAPNLAVWQTTSPVRDGDVDLFEATVALTLTAVGNETEVHVRERYLTSEVAKGRMAAAVQMVVSAVLVPSVLRKNNRFLHTAPTNYKTENRK